MVLFRGSGHHPANCRFKTQSCHHCKGVGHIARMCRKKRRDESTKAAAAPSATPSKQKGKPRSTHQLDQEEVGVLFSLTSKGGVNVTMNVAGSDVDVEVETGATVTVIPTGVFQSALSHVQLSGSAVRLQTYSGELLEVPGEADVPVRYGNRFAVPKIVVVDVSNKPAILGRSWLQVIHMDWSSLFQVQGENKEADLLSRLPIPVEVIDPNEQMFNNVD